jgi:flagellum-specific peptidoglycan hydrolase FlgJ
VTVSTGGVITGFNFVPGAAATMTSPTSVPLHLLALERAASPGTLGDLAAGSDSAGSVASDAQLRAAIVNVAGYYLRLAQTRSSAQMEALIWDNTSSNGADHGPSCAAFASLALELAAQAVGQQSWVSGGGSYPYPLPEWADVRVDTNPDSPAITSMVADAQAHARWHPLGDGYRPQPGDWVLFRGHVEVITGYHDGVLDTIGADSLPGLTVNAHSFGGSFAGHGVEGFIDNGNLKPSGTTVIGTGTGAGTGAGATAPTAKPTSAPTGAPRSAGSPASPAATPASAPSGHSGQPRAGSSGSGSRGSGSSGAQASSPGNAIIPGIGAVPGATGTPGAGSAPASGSAPDSGSTRATGSIPGTVSAPGADAIPGTRADAVPGTGAAAGAASIPGLTAIPGTVNLGGHARGAAKAPGSGSADSPTAAPAPTGRQASPSATPTATPTAAPVTTPSAAPSPAPASSSPASSGRQYATPGTRDQQAFISLVAPGAVAAQQRYGVPAAVTIAQAIEESAWGRSGLAAQYHNLFGIKGTGPAGSVSLPTSEFQGGQWVSIDAQFRVYHNDAESIADHAELLATSGYYTRAMADRGVPDAFANDLTGVYATDPEYGANLIALMRLYNLYQFDAAASHATGPSAPATPHATHATHATVSPTTAPAPTAAPTGSPYASPTATPTASPAGTAAAGVTPSAAAPGTPGTGGSAAQPTAAGHGAAGRAGFPGSGRAQVPGVTTPALSPTVAAGRGHVAPGSVSPGTTRQTRAAVAATGRIPGLVSPVPLAPAVTAIRYEKQFPHAVTTAFFASAKTPLARGEQLYRDVAARCDIPWKLLAAVDWMECKADPRYSPVHGERLGSLNADGTSFATKSAALTQCACDLVELAAAVYGIDLTARRPLSVRALADAFAAFRWGALLRRHGVSAMEFPYSVAGLTAAHQKMHWPGISDPSAPDRPGARFREPFGAVPVVLSLGYPATV